MIYYPHKISFTNTNIIQVFSLEIHIHIIIKTAHKHSHIIIDVHLIDRPRRSDLFEMNVCILNDLKNTVQIEVSSCVEKVNQFWCVTYVAVGNAFGDTVEREFGSCGTIMEILINHVLGKDRDMDRLIKDKPNKIREVSYNLWISEFNSYCKSHYVIWKWRYVHIIILFKITSLIKIKKRFYKRSSSTFNFTLIMQKAASFSTCNPSYIITYIYNTKVYNRMLDTDRCRSPLHLVTKSSAWPIVKLWLIYAKYKIHFIHIYLNVLEIYVVLVEFQYYNETTPHY